MAGHHSGELQFVLAKLAESINLADGTIRNLYEIH